MYNFTVCGASGLDGQADGSAAPSMANGAVDALRHPFAAQTSNGPAAPEPLTMLLPRSQRPKRRDAVPLDERGHGPMPDRNGLRDRP